MLLHLRCFLSYLDDLVSEVALVPKSNPTNTVASRKSDVRPRWCRLHHVLTTTTKCSRSRGTPQASSKAVWHGYRIHLSHWAGHAAEPVS